MNKVHLIYFSPAFSTREIIRSIGKAMNRVTQEHDITQGLGKQLKFSADDLVVFGIPVYAGRVPALAAEYLQKIKGDSTPVILVCVYGNREYDDALLELKDITLKNGFNPISAGAFIARHSIFPKVAMGRPNEADNEKLEYFAKKSLAEFETYRNNPKELEVKGNFPYREPSRIPLIPNGNHKCDRCGACVKKCLTNAIPEDNPKKTNKDLCISCARCIAVCPQQARKFRGLIYKIAGKKFEANYGGVQKEPEFFF